jgi:hypothetical protein
MSKVYSQLKSRKSPKNHVDCSKRLPADCWCQKLSANWQEFNPLIPLSEALTSQRGASHPTSVRRGVRNEPRGWWVPKEIAPWRNNTNSTPQLLGLMFNSFGLNHPYHKPLDAYKIIIRDDS